MKLRSLRYGLPLLLLFPVQASAGLLMRSDDSKFSIRGSALSPIELSRQIDGNYSAQTGFSVTAGFDFWGPWPPNIFADHHAPLGYLGYRYSSQRFEYAGPEDLGTLDPMTQYQGHEIFLDLELPLFSSDQASLNFVHGMHSGIGKFKMSDELFGFLDDTRTELGPENNDFQNMHGGARGLRLAIGDHVSASTDIDFFLSPQYNKFWHTEISSFIWNLLPIIPSAFVSEKRCSTGWVFCFGAIDTALMWWYYDVQARQYNWPYDDGEALRWKTVSLGASVSF